MKFGFAPLRAENSEGGAGGGTPAPPAPPAPSAKPESPVPPPVDVKAIRAEASKAAEEKVRKDLFAKYGVENEDQLAAAVKEAADARASKQTEAERAAAEAAASEKKRAKLEAERDALAAERTTLSKRLVLLENGVKGGEDADIASTLLEKAQKAAGDAFDQAAFFAKLKTDRPYLFVTGTPAGAPPPPGAGANTAPPPNQQGSSTGLPPGGSLPDANKMSPEEYRVFMQRFRSGSLFQLGDFPHVHSQHPRNAALPAPDRRALAHGP